MAYVVVAFAIINSAALILVALYLMELTRDIPTIVETVIVDEVRKQDDRIEKRVAKVQGKPETGEEALAMVPDGRIAVGRPLRR